MKILLVEDELVLSESLKKIFQAYDYEVDCAHDGLEAVYYTKNGEYELIIMDVMMPRMDGIHATKAIRELGINTPIIMLTAKSEVNDKIVGLDAGADDYLSKPFHIKELLARMRALLRRNGNIVNEKTFGDLTINPNMFSLSTKDGTAVLTKKEFKLFEYLIRHQERYTSTETILSSLWDDEKDVDITVVWVHFSNIRKKLNEIKSDVQLDVSRGKGYRVVYAKKD